MDVREFFQPGVLIFFRAWKRVERYDFLEILCFDLMVSDNVLKDNSNVHFSLIKTN